MKAKPRIPKSRPITMPNGPRMYICSYCKEQFTWGPGCAWFGSLTEVEAGKPLVFACSDPCFKALQTILDYPPLPGELEEAAKFCLSLAMVFSLPVVIAFLMVIGCGQKAAFEPEAPAPASRKSELVDTCTPPACWPDKRPQAP